MACADPAWSYRGCTLNVTRLSPSTKRSKLTQFIKDKKSRQECEPIIAHLVDFAFAEPLHNSNIAWQYIYSILLRDRGGGGAGRAAAQPLFCAPAPTFCAEKKNN